VLHSATPSTEDCITGTPFGLYASHDRVDPYQGIADTIVQLFTLISSGVIVSRDVIGMRNEEERENGT